MRYVWRSWPGRIGAVLVGGVVVAALVSLVWTPYDPKKVDPGERWLPISWDHWFGTDGGGKDLFTQVLVGARTTLLVAAGSVLIAAVIGLTLGVLSAISPRWAGEAIAHLIDVLIALPTLILALVFVAALEGSVWTVSLAIGIGFGVVLARVVRGEVARVLTQRLHPRRRRVGLVDVADGVAAHPPQHRADRDRAAVAVRRPGGARRGGAELPRADPGRRTPSWGRMLEGLQQSVTVHPGSARVPGPRGGPGDARVQPPRRRPPRGGRSSAAGSVGDRLADVHERRDRRRHGRRGLRCRPFDDHERNRVVTLLAGRAPHRRVRWATAWSTTCRSQLDRGQRLGIIGESGSGKTLSALSIIGLAPDVATVTGSVALDGVELLGRSDRELARIRGDGIAMVFQNPMTALNPVMRVGRQISEPLRIHQGLGRSEAAAVALEWCRRVALPDPERTVNAYPHQLSGGQRQRVGIAIALACNPALLIADEPTTALDVTVQSEVLALLDTLIAEEGTALVFITHDIALVSEVAQSVVVMRDGRIVEHGTTDELVRRPQSRLHVRARRGRPPDVVGRCTDRHAERHTRTMRCRRDGTAPRRRRHSPHVPTSAHVAVRAAC